MTGVCINGKITLTNKLWNEIKHKVSIVMKTTPFLSGFWKDVFYKSVLIKGVYAYSKKEYLKAYKILKPIADLDISDPVIGYVQYYIGKIHYFGTPDFKDYVLSRSYLEKSVQKGCNQAASFLLRKAFS